MRRTRHREICCTAHHRRMLLYLNNHFLVAFSSLLHLAIPSWSSQRYRRGRLGHYRKNAIGCSRGIDRSRSLVVFGQLLQRKRGLRNFHSILLPLARLSWTRTRPGESLAPGIAIAPDSNNDFHGEPRPKYSIYCHSYEIKRSRSRL